MRELVFDELVELDMSGAAKPFLPHPRKLTMIDGQKYLLKVDGPRARIQRDAELLKPLFGLRPMGHELVYVTDKQSEGILLHWHKAVGALTRCTSLTPQNIAALWRILVFDGVIGNKDRNSAHVLLLERGELVQHGTEEVTILAIDEGDANRDFVRWVNLGLPFKKLLRDSYKAVEPLLEDVERRAKQAAAMMERPVWIERLRTLPAVIEATKAQVFSDTRRRATEHS